MTVYLDHAATTPMRPEAIAALAGALTLVGNPSSIHSHGQEARRVLEEAREAIARALDADPVEVVLTSGGTESVNLGIKGLHGAQVTADPRRTRILVPDGEHHATVDTVEWLERRGAVVERLPIDDLGRIRVDAVAAALAADPGSVSLLTFLAASNEVGTIQPVEELAALAASHGVPVHVDAVAALGHMPVPFRRWRDAGVHAVSVSAHKVGGPVGSGALVLARQATVDPQIHGGGQQRQVRSGTQDAASAVAFATAVTLAVAELDAERVRLQALRDRLVATALRDVTGAVLRGDPDPAGRLPGNAHLTFAGCQGDSLLLLLDMAGVSVSTGSACQAGVPEVSHVLLGMGIPEDEARGALRFTLGRTTTDADVDALLAALPDAVARASLAGLAGRAARKLGG
ncbi:cysteine desulfurase family protein [Clavibacter sepedonicus]|uniref:cysteine desulfurase n=1 Tax=Clavibacter sepedonicus TaxID=31964 RepID=B0RGA5_CLASE|nr:MULTISPECIES: cysteine desulfurase family protein [Clavibacter]MBD5381275.1 cysteine desulfurase [Clavibacter sp.]OQJ46919.1 cysteine desulfurase NifS [Clavibacter sepedonicus]OQJ55106.1 cysteine desulfurase NifS [Clavibacter sepedonicus]UUK66446.1 cysteine desulfurase [Clavibacter sepedonicus]CAQ01161.1 putative cysteine desulfurase [Clavibacter sepedonicus]